MKASAVIGKTIKHVYQYLAETNAGRRWAISTITFTDGSRMAFSASEHPEQMGYPIIPRFIEAGEMTDEDYRRLTS